jgi:hypothetical protein
LALVGRFGLCGFLDLLAVVVLVHVIAPGALVLEARAAFAQHAEIMVRELQIIFRLDTVAGELGVTRHALVFLKQLGGVAPLAIILTVPRLSAEVLSPLAPTAAPAAALSVVDQMPTSLRGVVAPFASGRQGRARLIVERCS